MEIAYPPPWALQGAGYLFLYQFAPDFVATYGFVPPEEKVTKLLGAVMVVRYAETAVGPYDELLFVPGFMQEQDTQYPSITKIYVSSQTSVLGGRQNWAIPKELAQFSWQTEGNDEVMTVRQGDEMVAEWRLRQPRLTLPTYINLLPARFRTVMQQQNGQTYFTTLTGNGQAGLTQLHTAYTNPDYFPPVHLLKPIVALRITTFKMTFPVPVIRDAR